MHIILPRSEAEFAENLDNVSSWRMALIPEELPDRDHFFHHHFWLGSSSDNRQWALAVTHLDDLDVIGLHGETLDSRCVAILVDPPSVREEAKTEGIGLFLRFLHKKTCCKISRL